MIRSGAKPASKKPTVPFRLTERDVEIIRAVETHGLLRSRDHLWPLFGGSRHVSTRLKALTEAGFLARLKGRVHEQAIYALGKRGGKLLRDRFGYPMPHASNWAERYKRLTERHVDHTLLVADVLTGVDVACQARDGVRYVSQAEIIEQHVSTVVKRKALEVSGKPMQWDVRVSSGEWRGRSRIEPDGLFGIEHQDTGKTSWFFLEADRGTMPVKPLRPRLDRSTLFKKMLQYHASWLKDASSQNQTSQAFGLSDVRTLFVLATGARGSVRLETCLEANRYFRDGKGHGLFLFANRHTLLEADNILDAPLVNGMGREQTLMS